MHLGAAQAFVFVLGLAAFGCAETTQATAPKPTTAERTQQIAREQQELEQRRLQLENQLLAELHKLREGRQASAGAPEPARDDKPETAEEYNLLVFGGGSHEIFLGCLCEEHRPDSVFNLLGEHGADGSSTSLRNKFAPYGSNHDDTSACNPEATHPPVVIGSDGKSLGLLTSNLALKRRISAPAVIDWLARMCGE